MSGTISGEQPVVICQQRPTPGLEREAYEARLDKLMDDAFNDTQMVTAVRSPSYDELCQLFIYAYEGWPVDF